MSKEDIIKKIDQTERALNQTSEAAGTGRGVLNDVVAMVVPMQLDQLKILREIAALLPAD